MFVTAFLWGLGVSLGAGVGLLAYGIAREPLLDSGVKNVHEESLVALLERNRLTEETNAHLADIARSVAMKG